MDELLVLRDQPLVSYTRPPPALACPMCLRPFAQTSRDDAWYPTPAYFHRLPPVEEADPDVHFPSSEYYAQYFTEIRKLAVKKIAIGDDAPYLAQVLKEVRILGKVRKHHNVLEYNHSWIDPGPHRQ